MLLFWQEIEKLPRYAKWLHYIFGMLMNRIILEIVKDFKIWICFVNLFSSCLHFFERLFHESIGQSWIEGPLCKIHKSNRHLLLPWTHTKISIWKWKQYHIRSICLKINFSIILLTLKKYPSFQSLLPIELSIQSGRLAIQPFQALGYI